MDLLISYLREHALIGVGLALLVGMIVGSIFKKLLKLAFWLGLIFLAGLYLTHRDAEHEWQARAHALKRQGEELLKMAGEKAVEYGEEALDKGKSALEKRMQEKD
jgi:ElaB/YqjD/DUF883 family membrane-anchored ribosome-binding protein